MTSHLLVTPCLPCSQASTTTFWCYLVFQIIKTLWRNKINETHTYTRLHLDTQLTVCSGLGVWLQARVSGKFPQARLLTSFVLLCIIFQEPQMEPISSFSFGHETHVVLI